jgi:PAS domain S-box-containing protein
MTKILAIDDINDNLISLKAILHDASADVEVFTALSGKKGIEMAMDIDPDVIFLDIVMPGMDGFEVCRTLKKNPVLQDTPVIFLTALKETKENRLHALNAGAEAFLTKPIDLTELTAQLRAMLKIRQANISKRNEKDRLETLVKIRTEALEKELEERKRAEKKILENEANIKAIIENSLENIWSINTDLEIEYVNEHFVLEFQQSFGVKLEKGVKIIEALPKELQPIWRARYQRAFNNEHFDFTDKIDLGHQVIYIEVAMNPIVLNGKVTGISFYGKNITDRIEAQDEIVKNKELYKAFFDDDLTGDYLSTADGKLIDCNPAYLKMLGFRNKDQAFKYDLNKLYLNTEDRDQLIESVRKHGKVEDYEYLLVRTDGELLYVVGNIIGNFDKNGNLKSLKGYIFNNTKRKLAEKELIKLSRAVEQNAASIVITDSDSNIEYVNPKFIKLTGYSLEEVKGKNPRILQSGNTSPELYKKMWRNLLQGIEWKGEFQNRKKNGDYYCEWASISPIFDEKGVITHFLAVKEDITEKKQLMEDLITAKEKAEESDRLKSAFLMNMSHEIRTPMNGVLGFLGLLAKPNLDEASKMEYMDIVNKSGQRLLSTINDIIEVSKIESGEWEVQKEEVNIADIMRFQRDFFMLQTSEKGLYLRITEQIQGEPAWIITDKNKLDSILTNLLKNAIKFTNMGGIEMGNYLEKDQLVFYVKDSGIGIPADRLDAIFERFVQADLKVTRAHEGSGLGLSIAKTYVEALGGEIHVQSEVSKGSFFSFSIPYHVVAKQTETIPETTTPTLEKPQDMTILIAEDDEPSFQFMEIILASGGLRLLHTVSGEDTVKALRDNPSISLILMDINMPGMNGLEATKEIRTFNQSIPIIAQTAYAFTDDQHRALEAGCTDYISKPINQKKFSELIAKYVNR